jgi:hypothetical protein
MTKFVYNGEQELVFPTLGLTVKKGDVFEAPADFVADGVSISSSKKVLSSDELVETTVDVDLNAVNEKSE